MVTHKLLPFLLLAGCVSQPAYIRVCPSMPTYPKAFEQSAGNELAKLPPGDPLAVMTEDYLAVRKEILTCEKGS